MLTIFRRGGIRGDLKDLIYLLNASLTLFSISPYTTNDTHSSTHGI